MNVVADIEAEAPGLHPEPPVVVVGGGPSGMRAAQELVRRGRDVVLFNAERAAPYNRVRLTPLLAGEAEVGRIRLADPPAGPGRFTRYDGVAVVDVDPVRRRLRTSTGRSFAYSGLVLALGSRPFVPAVPGVDKAGVYVFRSLADTEALYARSFSARRVVVIGGGLLGLEAARGMSRRGAAVTVIEHEARLMPRQLDAEAAGVLAARIEALGIAVRTGTRLLAVEGGDRVEAVRLSPGPGEAAVVLPADTVIVCTGVRANLQLPIAIGLAHGRGVQVDEGMRTSAPDVYAVGECAEHAGVVHGLVGPGLEQAAVAAAVICGEQAAYGGSAPSTRLKVLGAEVTSAGDFESVTQWPGVRDAVFRSADGYRRILTLDGRLVAALGVGDWPEAGRLQEAVARRAKLPPFALARFARRGEIWGEAPLPASEWPPTAIVCNCTGVTRGAITAAVEAGAADVEAVRLATGANTVCGSCIADVQSVIAGRAARPEPVPAWRWLLGLSAGAGGLALASLALPRIPLPDTFTRPDLGHQLWFESIGKQWSGWTLLGLTAAAALLGLRRRVPLLARLGAYKGWRLVHLALGLVAAAALVWHTGFRLGDNLNLVLMTAFLASLVLGAVTGLVTGGEHDLRERGLVRSRRSPRDIPYWLHVLALWPLPVLIALHVLAVYTW